MSQCDALREPEASRKPRGPDLFEIMENAIKETDILQSVQTAWMVYDPYTIHRGAATTARSRAVLCHGVQRGPPRGTKRQIADTNSMLNKWKRTKI